MFVTLSHGLKSAYVQIALRKSLQIHVLDHSKHISMYEAIPEIPLNFLFYNKLSNLLQGLQGNFDNI